MAGTEKFCKVRVVGSSNVSVPYSQLLDRRSSQSLTERASAEATAEFLRGLPSHNENNFSRFQPDASCKSSMRKSSVYLSTKEHPAEQVITTEKTTILLRYLQQQFEKKQKAQHKRENEKAGPSGFLDHNPRKRFRVEDE